MNQLFSDDEEPITTTQLTINEHYAKAFEYRKEREELERLKAKYGSDYDPDGSGSEFSTDSESAESEDEHGEELTPAVDAAILRTLARIRKKDPEIYNSEKNIFGEEKEKVGSSATITQKKSKDKSKPVTLRQVNMEAMLNSSRESSPDDEPLPLTHVQEQEALRKETIAAFHKAAEQVDEDDLLVPREKTKDEREREEEEYRAFLEREVGDLTELVTIDDPARGDDASVANEDEDVGHHEVESKEKKKKKKSKKVSDESTTSTKKTKADEDQEFLLNYILNRGWIDKSQGHVPTYNEVTSPNKERRRKKEKSKAQPSEGEGNNIDGPNSDAKDDDEENDAGLLSDSSFESLASYFETSYNHRFEEPGAAIIPSFPRNLPSAVRREDTTRKEARERRKERKEQELQKKREEVKRLKALKMREVKRKLELIGKQAGLKKTAGKGEDWEGEDDDFVDEALRELDLEGEWDPEKHDRQMAGLFDRGAEAFEDEGGEELSDDGARYDENGKPIWDDDVDIGDIPISDDDANIVFDKSPKLTKKEKKKKKKKKDESSNDNDGVDVDAMDADVAPQYNPDEEWDGTEEMRKRKFNEYMDEIYGLDFNDLVGDLPTRFKYVPVQPQNYALTPAEILMATDQELNEYMSVKKYAPYRQDKRDANRWNPKTREKLHEIKSKVNERLGTSSFASGSAGHPRGEGTQGEKPKKRIGKKERMKLKAALGDAEGEAPADVTGTADAGDEPSRDSIRGETMRSPKNKKRKREIPNHEVADKNETTSKEAREHLDGGESGSKKKRKRRHRPADETVQS